jgi:hypothetical protein
VIDSVRFKNWLVFSASKLFFVGAETDLKIGWNINFDMKKSRKITLVFASILGSLFIALFFLISCRVDHTPYFKSSYYQRTETRLDSLKKKRILINDFVEAGFSKVNIPPV